MVNSREIGQLHPKVQELCNKFIAKCADQGIKVIITSTYRDNESQTQLYNQGRNSTGAIINKSKVVTYAKAGQSFHNYRLAFDFCPMIEGQCAWTNTLLFIKCANIGKSLGLESGMDFAKPDKPHLQYTNGLTWQDLQTGKTI
jgi:peptidoglycan L-alanyl-D-glutamate endopeptidase CwlK